MPTSNLADSESTRLPSASSDVQAADAPPVEISEQELGELFVALGSGQALNETFAQLLDVHNAKADQLGTPSAQKTIAASRFKALLLRELSLGDAPKEAYLNAVKAYWAQIHLGMEPDQPGTAVARLLATLAGDQDLPTLHELLNTVLPGDASGMPVANQAFAQTLLASLASGAEGSAAMKQAQLASVKAVERVDLLQALSVGDESYLLEVLSGGQGNGQSLDLLLSTMPGQSDANATGTASFQTTLLDNLHQGTSIQAAVQQAATVSRAAVEREAAIQGPLSPQMQFFTALANGNQITELLSGLSGGGSGVFGAALLDALAEGQDIAAAEASANQAVVSVKTAAVAANSGPVSPMGALLVAMASGENLQGALGGVPGLQGNLGAALFQNVMADLLGSGQSPLMAIESASNASQNLLLLANALQEPVTSEAGQLMAAMASGNQAEILSNLPAGKGFSDTLAETMQNGGSFAQAMNEAKSIMQAINDNLSTLQSHQVNGTLVAMATGQGVDQVTDIQTALFDSGSVAEARQSTTPAVERVATAPAPVEPAQPAAQPAAQPEVVASSAVTPMMLPVASVPVVEIPQPPPIVVQVLANDPAPRPENTVLVVNAPPTDLLLSNSSLMENVEGAIIGTLTVVDPDTSANAVFSLVRDVSGLFEVAGSSLKLKAGQSADFETASSHTVRLQVVDQAGASLQKQLTITVVDVNEAPTAITLSGRAVDENQTGALVGTLSVQDPDANNAAFLEIVSDPSGLFEISGNTLRLHPGQAANFEGLASHLVRVRATDQGGASRDADFEIVVNNLNEAPSGIGLVSLTAPGGVADTWIIAENQVDRFIATLAVADPDSPNAQAPMTVKLLADSSGLYQLDGYALQLKPGAEVDFENGSTHTLRILATDATNLSLEQDLVIAVKNVNEAPTDLVLTRDQVMEKSAGVEVGDLEVMDPDAGDQATFMLVEDRDNLFEISANTLRLKPGVMLDAAQAVAHTVRVRATDQGGESFEKSIEIHVINVNEAPTDWTLSSATVAENRSGAIIGTLAVMDPDAHDSATFSLVSDPGGLFVVEGDTLKLQPGKAADFELAAAHTLRIRATDQAGASFEKSVSIAVTNVNETPTDIRLTSHQVMEKSAGAVIGDLMVIDPDAQDGVAYLLTADGSGLFEIVGSSLKLKAGAMADAAQAATHTLRVQATDTAGAALEKNLQVTVINVNEAPTDITLSAASVAENAPGATVGTLTALDPDLGDSATFALVEDVRGLFVVNGSLLQLQAGSGADFETASSHTVRIRATDQAGGTFEKNLFIGVTNVNEAPTRIDLSSTFVSASTAGATVGTLTVTDPDAGDGAVYALVNDVSGLFEIVGTTLKVKEGVTAFRDGVDLHTLRLQVSDSGQLTHAQDFQITVTDTQRPPTDLVLSAATVNENDVGATVGLLTAIDPDPNATAIFSLVSDPGQLFEIVGNTLRLKAGSAANFESVATHTLRIRATDNTQATFEKNIDVTVNNVNEAPTGMALSSSAMAENSQGATVGVLSVIDPDAGDGVSYSLLTDAAGLFEIVGNTLKLKAGLAADFEAATTHSVRIRATDTGGAALEKLFSIAVNNVNEAPTNLILSASVVAENSVGATVGLLSVVDPDAGDGVGYTITGDASNLFVLNGNQLQLQPGKAADFETAASHIVRVRATDTGGATFEKGLVVSVSNVNEAPTGMNLSTSTLAENVLGATVGQLSVQDVDAGDQATFALVTDAAGLFEIVGSTLQVKAGLSANFEALSSHEVRIRAMDSGGATLEKDFSILVNNVNEAPTSIALSARVIAENRVAATVGQLSAIDPDAGDGVSFSLVTDSSGLFEIVGTTLQLKAGKAANFEAASLHTVRVRATDTAGALFEKDFSITVDNVNEAPTALALSTTTFAENSPGVAIGTLSVVDPDVGDGVTYALVSDASGLFELAGASLRLKAGLAADFEAVSAYTVRVRAMDTGGLAFEKDLLLSVTNRNEAPTAMTLSANSVEENRVGAVIGNLSVIDPDANDGVSYAIVTDASGLFTLAGSALQLQSGMSADFESAASHTLRVRATDTGGAMLEKELVIQVTNVNEAPIDLTLSSSVVNENTSGAKVGDLLVTDPDAGDGAAFALMGDASGLFEIVGSSLQLKTGVSTDFEHASSHTVGVRVTDTAGAWLEKNLLVSVNNLNDPPTATQLSAPESFVEDAASFSLTDIVVGDVDSANLVATLTLSAPGAGVLSTATSGSVTSTFDGTTWVANGAWADVNVLLAGVTFTPAANWAQNLTIHTRVSDGVVALEGQKPVSVTAVNDAPTATNLDAAEAFVEDAGLFSLHDIVVSDVDSALVTVTLTLSTALAGSLSTTTSNGVISTFNGTVWSASGAKADVNSLLADVGFLPALNWEQNLTIAVAISDGQAPALTAIKQVTVTPVNDAPVVTSGSAANWVENASGTVYTALGRDLDIGQTLAWSLGGADAAWFNITTAGALTFKSAPDYEAPTDGGANNVYDVIVTATDPGNLTASQSVVITVTNVNEAPSITSGTTVSWAENGTGTVYAATGSDPESQNLTWSLSGTDAALFSISTAGAITFKSAPDYEAPTDDGANNVYDVIVTATDPGYLTASQSVVITVTNVNEAPSITSGTTASWAENGTGTVYAATGSDPESQILTWSLSGTDAALFNISTTGAVTFKSAPDYEAPTDGGANNVYDVIVTATDPGNLTASQSVVITVTNVNEAPSITSGTTASWAENATGTVYAATGSDPESQTLTWSLSGTDAALFNISTAGAITFKSTPDYEAPTDSGANHVYDVIVTATDPGNLTASQSVAMTVTNVNEAPSITSGTTASWAENGIGTVYAATGSDPESQILTWSLSGTDAVLFNISTTGAVTFKSAPDYEAPTDGGANNVYDVIVTATDPGNLTASQSVVITVTNVNEAPSITSGTTASWAENGIGTVYAATGSDPESQNLIWSLSGTDAALFSISTAGALTFKSAPDYEAPTDSGANNVYDVIVTATDPGNLIASKSVAITVTNVNEAPSITSGATASWAENATGTVYAATGSDPESQSLTWSLSGTDAARFNISTAGAITFKSIPNYEAPSDGGANNVYDVIVTATDTGNLTASKSVAITVTNVNEAPSITSGATVSWAENGTGTVYAATGSDPENQTLTWSLSGTDADKFNISTAGALTFKSAPNYEAPTDGGTNNVYDVIVTAMDTGNLTASKSVAITVTNVNEAPSITSGATASWAENATGTVYTATGSDPENQSLTWSLGGTDAARFNISTAGAITFKSAPNYEAPTDSGTNNVYDLIVNATDSGNLTASKSVAMTVTNVNEAPSVRLPSLINQYATQVIQFSSQYSTGSWSASQVLGTSNTFGYGDIATSWTSSSANMGSQYLLVGYDTPVYANGVTVRETFGNGFVTQIDVLDTTDQLHTVWSGVDPSPQNAPVDFLITWNQTSYLVKGVKVYIDTNFSTSWEEVDSIQLHGNSTSSGVTVKQNIASHITGFTFSDLDGVNSNETVTFTVGSGSLSASSGGGVTVGGTATSLTLTGSVTNLNNFISNNQLYYTATASSTVNLGVSISDGSLNSGVSTVPMNVIYGVQVNFIPVVNADVVISNDKVLRDGADGSGGAFLTQSTADIYLSSPIGLIDSGSYAANSYHPSVQLLATHANNGNNVLKVTSSGTKNIDVTDAHYAYLHLFASSADGNSNVVVKLRYSDGSVTQTGSITVQDWFNDFTPTADQYYLINGMDRRGWNGSGMGWHDANDPAVFGFRVAVDNSKTLTSFDLVTSVNGSTALVFGATLEACSVGGATDPLVLDLDHNGIQLTSSASGTRFDMNNDGLLDQTGWIAPGDGLLVMDRNGDGRIQGIGELVSEYMVPGTQSSIGALATLDDNHDGRVDALDAGFSWLQVWQDANQDGVSDGGELLGLSQLGIVSLGLQTTSPESLSNADNLLTAQATFEWADGTQGTMAEVAFTFTDGVMISQSVNSSDPAPETQIDLTPAVVEEGVSFQDLILDTQSPSLVFADLSVAVPLHDGIPVDAPDHWDDPLSPLDYDTLPGHGVHALHIDLV